MTFAALGILGLGPVLARHPEIAPTLRALGGVGLVVLGLVNARRVRAPAPGEASATVREAARGVLAGLVTVCANPAALVVVGVVSLSRTIGGW